MTDSLVQELRAAPPSCRRLDDVVRIKDQPALPLDCVGDRLHHLPPTGLMLAGSNGLE